MRVLLVDDDVRTARRFARMLEEDGYRVDIAIDGGDAIERLDDGPPPDVLVTDLLMPRASGIDVMRHARAVTPELPVVFVTGHPELLHGLEASEPAPIVITKPLSYGAVHALLNRLASSDSRGNGRR